MSRRSHRVQDLLRSEISDILARQVNDPRVRLASISGVEVARDLRHATIRVSILGDDANRDATFSALVRARKFIRYRLADRLRHMRAIPELHFELDRGAEHSERIHELLENLE